MTSNGDDIGVWLRRRLDDFEAREIDARQIADHTRRRRRRHLGGYAIVAVAAVAVIALVLAASPSDQPLGPPTVSASAQLTMPGRVLDSAADGGTLWVLTCDMSCNNASEAGAGRGDLVKVNNATGVIEETIPVNDPHSLAVGEGGVWVVSIFGSAVSRFDPATGELVASIPLSLPAPAGEGPGAFEFLPFAAVAGAGSVWVATARGYVAEVDPQTNEVVRRIETAAPANDLAVAGESVWVTAQLDGVVRIAASGVVSAPAPIEDSSGLRLSVSELFEADGSLWAGGAWSQAIGKDPEAGYVVTGEKGVVELDPQTGEIRHVATVPMQLSVTAVSGSRVWLADSPSREIYELDSTGTKTMLVARLSAEGTIIGSVGNSVWLAEPDRVIAKYELPTRG
jgi:streptogramin lyase